MKTVGTSRSNMVNGFAGVMSMVIAAGDEVCQIDFKLPKRSIGDSVPQVVERKTCWGWRFKSNCLIHDTGWNLVDTKEQVLEDAAKWVDNKLNVRNHDRPEWLDYLKDVREIEPLKNPLLDIVNNA